MTSNKIYSIDFYKNAMENTPKRYSIEDLLKLIRDENFSKQYNDYIVSKRGDSKFSDYKKLLPAWTPMGVTLSGKRKMEDMNPTPLLMIDIDNCSEPTDAFNTLINDNGFKSLLVGAHVTPSGKGLRLLMLYPNDNCTIATALEDYTCRFGLDKLGKVDKACKDLTRLSFLVPNSEWLHIDFLKLNNDNLFLPVADSKEVEVECADKEQQSDYSGFSYRGTKVKDIIDKYVEEKGVPEVGERHNFYNMMIKDFRCICDNNPDILVSLLPRFGHTYEECISQCRSITKRNDNHKIPVVFFKWLCENGFYKKETDYKKSLDEKDAKTEYLNLLNEAIDKMPPLPPVFREFVDIAPRDFKIPVINALMPIMGTMASFLRSNYFDGREQSTTFFNVIYAPASHGKSFPEKIMPYLWEKFSVRDKISEIRESLYMNLMAVGTDKMKEKAENPNVSLRKVPANVSQPELLTKMRDCHGYHIFTYESEIDTWRKGSKAANNDKSDMIRVAWDNGEYGQAFKSVSTFKGSVNLYWNVLLTGTTRSMMKYFSNVEDGLVTRCSFCSLGDQRFAKAQIWKPLGERRLSYIKSFVDYCDYMSYEESLGVTKKDLERLSPKDFSEEAVYDFRFKPFVNVDMSWIFPNILNWLEEERLYSSECLDDARDSFRRRTAVKGFRLALLCTSLYRQLKKSEKEKIWNFIKWWMDIDIENSLYLFGKEYNDVVSEENRPSNARLNLINELPEKFTKIDLMVLLRKSAIRTPAPQILTMFKKNNYIKKVLDEDNKIYYINLKKHKK